ncbi:MazG family protein [Actinokineospora sp. NBRC 105648]|uniref:MazG family protein n=1 Tax=Actinokineospora sp. NBRC 105648 TaxID=3032206 RepID=UPI00249FAA33|nr:MazG family protein [Actinokineospora sp. NBRC 105648]GLZ39823.1 nucleoside triphosphate pyrophosphohydrolase [Actinokineospora sp. NBRC 105648]
MTPHAGTAVVLVSADTVPASAVPALRTAEAVYVAGGADPALGTGPVPEDLLDQAARAAVVVVTDDLAAPGATDLVAAGAPVHRTPGTALLEAARVMDVLRAPGGCPWDAKQTHESLRQYLVEESYELLDAIDDGDRAALREELGDVLLQVLFHARVAEEDPSDPFGVDEVAAGLVDKLVSRHPHVFAGGDPAVRDASTQEFRWEELKQREKRRESSVDGVAMGQPAVALAAKLTQRAARAGLPAELLPHGDDLGDRLFALAAEARLAGRDPEHELRAVARRFARDVRAAESAARANGANSTRMEHGAWLAHWPDPSSPL